ncbi:hypothetical protein D1831_02445 [Lactiplantibacillus garii]|uniref:Uncharacterized protein n=1 Tax=Lactiplantibacillus garii TaxID=2306423 RepID=A0A426DA20_9LACO|nr:hypothetical protein [Lactiplantibacillus garii]RRK11411.1 hypothetical protein D1831_02445 [Lactiplantibacillus garii]
MNNQLLQFIQKRFQTRFRFRNAFESRLTVGILTRLILEHSESLLLTRREIETLTGCSLDDPVLQREYFPQRTITLLETALDELTNLSLVVTPAEGRIQYPLFRSIQIDQVCERIVFNLNLDVLPQLTDWSKELRHKQEEFINEFKRY